MSRQRRPPIKPTVKMTIWVLAEMFRDRKDSKQRFSARHGCERLEVHLSNSFKGGRVLPFDTIRRHYKEFKKLREGSEGKDAAALADQWLAAARANREAIGWDASTWIAVIDPNELRRLGYEVVLHGPGINDPKAD